MAGLQGTRCRADSASVRGAETTVARESSGWHEGPAVLFLTFSSRFGGFWTFSGRVLSAQSLLEAP